MNLSKIGRYEVESELTQGGMGIIFLARDPYIQRQVVVKVLMAVSSSAVTSTRTWSPPWATTPSCSRTCWARTASS